MRLAEAGQDAEAMALIDLTKLIQETEDKARRHTEHARAGIGMKISTH